jgi:hypothetical protein
VGFNKSSQSSTQSNQAFGFLKDQLGGTVSQVGQAGSALAALLGGDRSGLSAFQKATGFGQQMNFGLQGVSNAGAAGGLLNSGSTRQSLAGYGQMLQNQSAQSYIQNLLGMGQMGLGAAGAIGGAGGTSSSKGSSKGLQFNPMTGG